MLHFRELTIHFDPTRGRTQRERATAVFPSGVRLSRKNVQAMLKGFHTQYTDGDHHIWKLQVDLDVISVENNSVTVAANFLIRDSSGRIDDRYDGWVQCVIMAQET